MSRLLAAFGLTAADLANTPALPLSTRRRRAGAAIRGGPTSLLQNCSGKHAAMLAACVVNGWPTEGYLEPAHPVQQLIDTYIGKAAGGVVHTGVDGCGAPTAMVPLLGLAMAVRDLAVGREATYRAMTDHPELVDGAGRHDTDLMRLVPGLLVKGGAEAIYVAAHPDGRAVALKIARRRRAGAPARDAGRAAIARIRCRRRAGPARSSVTVEPVGEIRSLVGER